MKNLIKLTVLISLFFGTLYAQNINECKTDIYFGNGVWNSAKGTEASIRELHEKIINPFIIKNDLKLKAKYGQIKLQYNWGQGAMLDVLETYYQLKEAGQVSDYQFFAVIAILTKGNPILTLGAVASKELMEPFTRAWEQGNVDDMWQKYYDESFKLSHKVLLISHSQGNLFANRIYDKINPTGYKDYFANMQIASPASEVKAQKGDYVTLSTDLTSFDPVINFIPGSMSPNVAGESGHELVSAYLLQADPLNKITTKIKQLLANLDVEPSQWELENELNKGTKDYKITLKHRFDTSITTMQDIEVYPFSPSKKLYYVQGIISGYVKARCGGFKIETTWVGQDTATKIAKLSHTTTLPHEYIAPKCGVGYHFEGTTCVITPFVGTVYVSGGNNYDTWNDWSVGLCYSQFTDFEVLTFATASIGGQSDCSNFIMGQKLYPRPYTDYDTTPIQIAFEASMVELGGAGKALAGSLVSQATTGFHPSTYTITTTEDDGTDIWNIWISYKITGI
ncbi:MAG: hypothetical protein COA39_002590 [Sulfurimonas sp.]|nr:hypothetical protein [Sulfurimonas sp.]